MSRQRSQVSVTAESAAYGAFLKAFPDYDRTRGIDTLRASGYRRLDAEGHVYLDYTGGGLHAEFQVRDHAEMLNQHVLGNPHSANLTSSRMTMLIEQARRYVLNWFNAGDDYAAVFTQNATAALKLVGEAYPFSPDSTCLLTVDNHNSVNGIREYAITRGASVAYASLTAPELRIDRTFLASCFGAADRSARNLFVFPAQSNFSGVVHPLECVEEAHAVGWDVLLDAAAYVPSNRLNLQLVKPDFVSVSFYKMFGYPTGVGCLLARRTTFSKLRRPWFAGGTVNFATVNGRHHILSRGEAGFEDGTLNYLAIPAVEIGLRHLASVGVETINTRIRCLTAWLLERLLDLRHSNGRYMVRIYGPLTVEDRGGTVTMNVYDEDGRLLNYRRVEELASEDRISLRTGCFCNPGAGEAAEGLTDADMEAALRESSDMTLPRFLQFVTHHSGKSAGAIRVSLGLVSNFSDVYRFVRFVEGLRDQTQMTVGEATFDIESCRVMRDGS